MSATVAELAALVGGEVRGDAGRVITGAQSTVDACGDDITFAVNEANLRRLAQSAAGAALISKSLAEAATAATLSFPVIVVDYRRGSFCGVLEHVRPRPPRPEIGISPQAYVDPTASIGPGTNVYPGASIGPETVIGGDCDIHPGVSIGGNCCIGSGCTIYPNAVLYDQVKLGDRVIIHATAVLGADGFGYQLKNGAFEKIPQLGTVIIEDDVEIGAGTTVDRAMIGATKIGRGTKLDNQIMIGHNCVLGAHNVFASQVGLAGSVTTGDYVMCAGQVGIADHVHIGDGARLASKAGVHKDLKGGQAYVGQPVQPERDGMKSIMAVQKLPQMARRLRKIETQIESVESLLTQLRDDDAPPLAKAG